MADLPAGADNTLAFGYLRLAEARRLAPVMPGLMLRILPRDYRQVARHSAG